MRYITKLILGALSALAATGGAQTITVAKSGTPTHATIQAAIDSFASDSDPRPNVIQITDSSVYDEIFSVYVPVTIEGTASSRPVLTARTNSNSFGIIVSNRYPGLPGNINSIVLKNLIVIPSLAAPPPGDGMVASGMNLYFELNNVLITANNGSDRPVSTDGLTRADTAGAVFFGDDGLSMGSGQGFTGVLKDTVITHILGSTGARQDGLELSVEYFSQYRILDGCVFSFCKRLGIYGNGGLQIDAPTRKCLIINNGGFAGIWWEAGGDGPRRINGAIVANNGGYGIEHQNGDGSGLTISNSIIANNTNGNLKVSEVRTVRDVRLTNVTIGKTINPAASAIDVDSRSSASLFLQDCIIAGNGSTHTLNTLLHNGTGTLNLEGTALVTAGPQSMVTITGGTGIVSGTPTTTTDPQFVNTTDVTSPDYFNVANTAYSMADSAGGPLGGGADFVGGSSVNNWTIY